MSLVNRRSLAGFCAAGAMALAAGCGGGGDDASDTLSPAEFRTQADAICQTSKDAIAALPQPTAESTGAQVSSFLNSGLEASDAQIAELRALAAPSDLAGTVDEALDLLEQRQTRIRAVAGRVAAGEDFETVAAQAKDQIDALNEQADAKARELGLTVCGTDSDDVDAAATTGTTATAPSTAGGAASAQVTTDLKAVQTAWAGVVTSLQAASGAPVDDVKAVVPDVREALSEFDDAIATLAGETSPGAAQEKVRAAVASAGATASETLGRLLDALEDEDQAAAATLVPEVQKAIGDLQTALAG